MGNIYNLSNATNTTNFYKMTEALHNTTGGLVGNAIVIVGFFITYISLYQYTQKQAISAASYIWSVITLLLWTANLASDYILIAMIFLSAFSTAVLLTQQNR